jgi:hypothetical protein
MRALLLLLLLGTAHAHPHGDLHRAGYMEETLFWWEPGPAASEALSGLVADLSEVKGCPGRFVVGDEPTLFGGFRDDRQVRDRQGEPRARARSMVLAAIVDDTRREERAFLFLDTLSNDPAGFDERMGEVVFVHQEETLTRGTKEEVEATATADDGHTRVRLVTTWFEEEVQSRHGTPAADGFRAERHRTMLPHRVQTTRDPGHALLLDRNLVYESLPMRGTLQVKHQDSRIHALFNDPGNTLTDVSRLRLDYALYRIEDLGCQ